MKKIFYILFILIPVAALATLTAVVTPGYQFPADGSVAPTPSLLNLLGEPSISIYGTIGGSNSISPGTVDGVALADSVPDGGALSLPIGSTMGWNVHSPRQLAVNTAGIVNGLGGIKSGGTNALYLYIDPTYFLLATNSLGTSTNTTTGSGTNWLTLQPSSLADTNITPGGISSQSITTNGLWANRLATEMILTNDFPAAGVTNTSTNYNTIIYGTTNGVGELVLLDPTFAILTNEPVIATNIQAGVTNFFTNYPPTLKLTPYWTFHAASSFTVSNWYATAAVNYSANDTVAFNGFLNSSYTQSGYVTNTFVAAAPDVNYGVLIGAEGITNGSTYTSFAANSLISIVSKTTTNCVFYVSYSHNSSIGWTRYYVSFER